MNLRLTIATVLTTTLLVSCSGPKTEAPKPVFEPPRMGVFISPVPIAESTDDEFEPALIQELGMVVYSVMAAGNQDLYAKTIGGGEPLRLTNHSTNDTDPAISKAPHKIAWTAQSEDVKGDIWIMDLDGSQKKRLTNRQSADRSPVFSADGTHLYFSTQPQGQSYERIEKISLANLQREVVVKKGWDPAISPDGNILFFVQLDEKKKSRIYAKRLLDNKTIALTRGTYPEGMPRVRLHKETLQVVFTRFVDDENGDNSLDADDPSSLWVTELKPSLFDGDLPPLARPLTTGGQSEIFAALGADYMLFTGGQRDGLDIWALPASGVISKDATPELILQAARREEVPSLKRMALRSLIASAPHMASRARYELARDLAEREKWGDAMAELLMIRDNTDIIGTVAAIEYQRLRLLEVTGDSLYLRDPAGRALAQKLKTLIKKQAENPKIPGPAKVRAELSLAELDYATGERLRAAQIFRKIATQTTAPTEDRARAFDRLGQIHEDMGEFEAVADTCQKQLELFSSERHTAHNAARRWVRVATSYTGIPVAASLEHIQSFFGNLSQVAALAAEKLAELHLQAGREDMAIDEWQRIVRKYPSERASLGRALLALGKVFAERNDDEFALATYERIMSKFPETPSLRRKAKLGITRIAFKKAKREESKGQWARARSSYKRLLQTNHELVLAHRRYITISARLRVLHDVIHEYRIAVEQNPQDKFSRYGLGYALTFLSPLPIPEAESEIVKTIELDPRFAPGHLTLGWLKMQREQRKPRSGWLESAEGSFRTALELLDHESNLELWAAAQLNRGNALLGLGATGQAFDSYLQRALSGAPFRNPLTQLLFYESFARTALREDKFDVALDMARRAYDHSLLIKGQPRLGTESAMIATIYSKIEFWEDAAWWFKKASDHFSKQGDLDRAIPTLRSRIMALRGAGLNNKALDDTRRLLELLKDGEHPTPFNRPLLSTEAPANPVNVSTAIYGFTPEQEATNAFTLGSRIRVEKLDIKTARDFDAQRIKEFEHFITNKRQAPRIQFEFAHVLHESAHLAWLANQDRESAQKLRRLLQLCRKNGYWNVAQVAIESALRVFSRTPQLIHHPLLQEALAAAHEALAEMATVGENEKAQSFARSLSLLHLAGSYAPRPPLDAKRNILDQSLRHLDQISTHRKDAQLFAYLASGDYFRTNIQAATGESPPCQKVRSDESWRTCYDAALACQNTDDKKLLLKDASERFKSAPGSQHPPELSRFFRDVAHSLIQDGKEEEAWKTLEQLRLLRMQMPTGSELITTSASITKALSGTPASLKAIRKSLEKKAWLIQSFNMGQDPTLIALITPTTFSLIQNTTNSIQKILTQIQALKKDIALPEHIYFDFSDRAILETSSLTLDDKKVITLSEVLSATWLVASFKNRNLATANPLQLGGKQVDNEMMFVPAHMASRSSLERFGKGRSLIFMDLPSTSYQSAALPPGHAYLHFSTGGSPQESEQIDLHTLSKLRLNTQVMITVTKKSDPRIKRALARNLLISGIPSLIEIERAPTQNLNQFVSTFSSALPQEGAAGALILAQKENPKIKARLLGYRGMSRTESVNFALNEILRLAKAGGRTFKAARSKQDMSLWDAARVHFEDLLTMIEFLLEPESTVLLKSSKNKLARALRSRLKKLNIDNQGNLAQIHLALGNADEAAALQEVLLIRYKDQKDEKKQAVAAQALGKTLSFGKRSDSAILAYRECIRLSVKTNDTLLQADCQSRLGSELREKHDIKNAVTAYQKAIQIYSTQKTVAQAYPRRYMGILQENSLNDYKKALDQYTKAREAATLYNKEELRLVLSVDIARVHRRRGSYSEALKELAGIQKSLELASVKLQGEASLEEARVYWYRGSYQRASILQERSLRLAQKAGLTFLEIQSISLAGLIALNQGELESAETFFRSALDLSRITGRRSEEAAQLNNLGIVQREKNENEAALITFERALAIDEELESKEGKAYDLRNIGKTLARAQRYAAALQALNKALGMSRAIGNRYNEVQCLLARGEVLEALKRTPLALQSYQEAAKMGRSLSLPEVEWRALYAEGRINYSNPDLALKKYLESINVAERVARTGASIGEMNRTDLYADAFSLALENNKLSLAFNISERGRGRELLDILSTSTLDLPPQAQALLSTDLKAREALLAARRTDEKEEVIQALQKAMTDARNKLALEQPLIARAFTISPQSLEELQTTLSPDTLVLNYFVGSDSVILMAIKKESVEFHTILIDAAELEEKIAELGSLMRAFAPLQDELSDLGEVLLGPVSSKLKEAKHIVILPHRWLYSLPFAALEVDETALVDLAPISISPSGSHLIDSLRHSKRAFGGKVLSLAPAQDLPFSHLQANAIAPSSALHGAAAQIDLSTLASFDALDLAAHTHLNSREPLLTNIEIAAGETAQLSAKDIFTLSSIPPLVTLSACESAVNSEGGALNGLASAFLVAGAHSVIATQNRVSDLSSAILMKRFYRKLANMGVAAALREAALDVRGYFPHPAHWSNFVLLGDYR